MHNVWCLKRLTAQLADPVLRKKIRDRERYVRNSSDARKAKKAGADQIRNARDEVRKKKQVRQALWLKNNRDKDSAKNSLRRARRLLAAPPWITAQMKEEMRLMYKIAARVSVETGVKHAIDHEVPLVNKIVCGLHVPANLCLLTAHANSRKYNKFTEVWS